MKIIKRLKTVISPFDKSKPKKCKYITTFRGDDSEREYCVHNDIICPRCGTVVGEFGDTEKLYYNNCPECRQLLEIGI